jgi:hypothetical protein
MVDPFPSFRSLCMCNTLYDALEPSFAMYVQHPLRCAVNALRETSIPFVTLRDHASANNDDQSRRKPSPSTLWLHMYAKGSVEKI